MTLIAASIAVHDASEALLDLERAVNAANSGANLIEWRIDALAEDAPALKIVRELVRGSPRPCIVTCRAAWEGGEYQGNELTRAELYGRLIQSDDRPRYVDVELSALERHPDAWRSVLKVLEEQSQRDLNTSLILSSHDFESRPRDLLQRIEKMTHDPRCAIVKVAWQARSLRDNLEAFDLLHDRRKPTIAICMGQFGLLSRVLAPKFGGFLSFAVDREMEITGPGQPTIDDLVRNYRFDQIGSQTRVFGVIGWPVAHSQSPAIHNAGFAAIGFDGVYLPLPIPPEYEHFKATVGAMIDHHGLNFRGASVTIPHKENLLRFVRERGGRIDPLAERIGAANTLVVGSAGGLECLNTDAPAAIGSLCEGMGLTSDHLREKKIAVLGAGGVARAIVAGLIDVGAGVAIFNRNEDRARRLADEFNTPWRKAARGVDDASGSQVAPNRLVSSHPLEQIAHEKFDIYINCTPVGMTGTPASNESPLPASLELNESMTVFDTVYTPARTPLIREAEVRGARVITGVDMFVRQAAMQFEKWTGVPAPRATFESILGGRRT